MMTPSSPLLGVARRTNPLNVLPSAISLSQTTLFPLEVNHTTTIRIWLPHRDSNSLQRSRGRLQSATQNLISEVLADASTEVNQTLPNMESLGKVVQRARASASGSAQHTESKTSLEFVLPLNLKHVHFLSCHMNSTPDPAHLQVNYTQSMDHITNYTPQASSLHVNYLMTYMVDHITSAPKSGSQKNNLPPTSHRSNNT